MAALAAASICGGPSVSGNPWPRFTAPWWVARAVISAKIVEPKPVMRATSGLSMVRRLCLRVRHVAQLAPYQGQRDPRTDEGEPERCGQAPPLRDHPAECLPQHQ